MFAEFFEWLKLAFDHCSPFVNQLHCLQGVGLDANQTEAKDGTRCDQVEFLSNTHSRTNGALRN